MGDVARKGAHESATIGAVLLHRRLRCFIGPAPEIDPKLPRFIFQKRQQRLAVGFAALPVIKKYLVGVRQLPVRHHSMDL